MRTRTWSRGRIVLASSLGAVALYAGLGFLVAPGIVKGQILKHVGELTERPVSVEKVRVNPFALSLTVEGFLVKDRDGTRLASLDRLYVNATLLGMLRREVGVEELLVDRPYLHAGLDARGELNVADILRRAAADDGKPPPPPDPNGIVLAVGHLAITEAQIDFTDRSRRRPFETTVGPVTLDLRNFRTRRRDNQSPYTFSGRTESGEKFSWSGNVFIEPIRSKGTFTFEGLTLPKYAPYYQDSTNAEVRKGLLGLRATYDLEWGTEKRMVKIVDGSVSLRDLVIGPRGGGDPVIDLPVYDVSGFHADVLTQDTEIGRMALEGGRIRVRREPDGSIDLVKLLGPPSDAPPAPEAAAAPPAAPGPGPAAGQGTPAATPRFRLDELDVKGVRFEVEDAVPSPPVKVQVAVEKLLLRGLSSEKGATATIDAVARVDGKGALSAQGKLRPMLRSGDLDLAIDQLDLAPLTPYLATALEARLEAAILGMKGHATFDASGAAPVWAFRGDFRLDGLRMADGRRGEEFLRWKSLRLEGVDAAPGRTALRSIRLLEPRLKVVVWEDKVRNLDVIARREQPPAEAKEGEEGPATEPPRPAAKDREPEGGPPQRWSIGMLQVTNGRASLVDRSVKPPAALEMTDLTVVVRGLSSEARSSARVQVDAKVGGAPLSVSGTLQPRFLGDATDLAIRSHAVDLTPLGPYVEKYAGYELQKGKLDLDLRYAVRQRTLEAQNLARIDQFTLGEERPGPDVTSLPVKLGLAVLTDKDGVIEIDVPVSGSIDDPDFSVGRMVWKTVGNLFTKLLTAPFAALGKMFGGGSSANLERVDFPAGTAAIDPAAEQTLAVLGKALRERPALRLEVEGSASEVSDGQTLRQEQAALAVRRAKWSELRRKQPGLALDDVKVGPDEYPRWLSAAFAALPPVPGAASDGEKKPVKEKVAPEEMEAALAAASEVPPEAYRELAARRADAARERLLAGGDLDPGRVFVAAGGERARKEGGARAYFELK